VTPTFYAVMGHFVDVLVAPAVVAGACLVLWGIARIGRKHV